MDKDHVFIVKGDTWAIRLGGQLYQGGTVQRIEVKEKLNGVELLITDGSNPRATAVSIFAVEGESLKYLNFGGPPPTEFVTKPGDGRHFMTFRRAKP